MTHKQDGAVAMKDSGVEWLGEIPAHWESMSLSDVADVLAGQSPASTSYNGEGLGLPFFQGKAEFGSRFPTAVNWCTEPEQVSESGDILISVRAPVGDVNIAPFKCCIGRGLAAIRANGRSHSIFLYYLLIHSKGPLESEGTGSTFKSIDRAILRRVAVPLPPLAEQRAIAAYLDRETAKIDALIAKTEQFNALLGEKRVALISQAVTKGLDPSAPLKESGVEWLGEIPRHWELLPIKAFTRRKRAKNRPDLQLLSVYRDYGVIPKDSRDDNHNRASLDLSMYQVVDVDDLAINKMKTWQGSLAVSQFNGIVSPAYIICELYGNVHPRFVTSSVAFEQIYYSVRQSLIWRSASTVGHAIS